MNLRNSKDNKKYENFSQTSSSCVSLRRALPSASPCAGRRTGCERRWAAGRRPYPTWRAVPLWAWRRRLPAAAAVWTSRDREGGGRPEHVALLASWLGVPVQAALGHAGCRVTVVLFGFSSTRYCSKFVFFFSIYN